MLRLHSIYSGTEGAERSLPLHFFCKNLRPVADDFSEAFNRPAGLADGRSTLPNETIGLGVASTCICARAGNHYVGLVCGALANGTSPALREQETPKWCAHRNRSYAPWLPSAKQAKTALW